MRISKRLLILSFLFGLGGCANFATVDQQVASLVECKTGSAISYRMTEMEMNKFPDRMHNTGGTCR